MRGFGVTIGDFALEVQMDKLARLVGMDPMEFRLLNAYRDGDMKAHGKKVEGAALIEVHAGGGASSANWPIAERFKRDVVDDAGGLSMATRRGTRRGGGQLSDRHESGRRSRARRWSMRPRPAASSSRCRASISARA